MATPQNKYIELSVADSQDYNKYRCFRFPGESLHDYFLEFNLPIYQMFYYSRKLDRYYYIPRWLHELLYSMMGISMDMAFSVKDAVQYVAYIYHNKALREKWQVILTLDPEYLYCGAGQEALFKDVTLTDVLERGQDF